MKVGIFGRPGAGKTTTFELLTGAPAGTEIGVARVADPRVDFLAGFYHPRKVTYATIEFSDIPAFGLHGHLMTLRRSDALLLVLRAFGPEPDPYGEASDLVAELALADLELVEKRLERLGANRQNPPGQAREIDALRRCAAVLGEGLPIRLAGLDEDQEKIFRGYDFLTRLPLLLAANVDEPAIREGDYPGRGKLEEFAAARGYPVIPVSARMEAEIMALDPADRQAFLADLGLEETGIERLARAVYDHLGLISFFTVGPDEVKAWTIRRGTTAREAAGKIHSDMERGFIRAEVIAYNDFVEAGSPARAKERGNYRLEGKDYLVSDGDIINFRFNV